MHYPCRTFGVFARQHAIFAAYWSLYHRSHRQEVLGYVESKCEQPLEGEHEKDKAAADRILARGKIRNDREYYLLRAYLEHLEGSINNDERQNAVAQLIDSYRA